jgi:hypothetical protein
VVLRRDLDQMLAEAEAEAPILTWLTPKSRST